MHYRVMQEESRSLHVAALAGEAALLAAVAVLASIIPAARAARMDPLSAPRVE